LIFIISSLSLYVLLSLSLSVYRNFSLVMLKIWFNNMGFSADFWIAI
jgi:hypothetical protein